MEYKRLTRKTINGYGISGELVNQKQPAVDIAIDSFDIVINRLAELEDKIENGTLVELPRIVHPNKAEWYVQYQYPSGIIQYDICFSQSEAEKKLAEEKLKELEQ